MQLMQRRKIESEKKMVISHDSFIYFACAIEGRTLFFMHTNATRNKTLIHIHQEDKCMPLVVFVVI